MSQEDLWKRDIMSRILKRAKNDSKFKELLSAFINLNEELVCSSPVRLPDGRPLVMNDQYMAMCKALAKGIVATGEDPHEMAIKIPGLAGELTSRMASQGGALSWMIALLVGAAAGGYIYSKVGKILPSIIVALTVMFPIRFLWKVWSVK